MAKQLTEPKVIFSPTLEIQGMKMQAIKDRIREIDKDLIVIQDRWLRVDLAKERRLLKTELSGRGY